MHKHCIHSVVLPAQILHFNVISRFPMVLMNIRGKHHSIHLGGVGVTSRSAGKSAWGSRHHKEIEVEFQQTLQHGDLVCV